MQSVFLVCVVSCVVYFNANFTFIKVCTCCFDVLINDDDDLLNS